MKADTQNRTFTEILSWVRPAVSTKGMANRGDDGEQAMVGATRTLRCCVAEAQTTDDTEGDVARFTSKQYNLKVWSNSLISSALAKDQHCTLSKVGTVIVKSKKVTGRLGIMSEIIVEAIA